MGARTRSSTRRVHEAKKNDPDRYPFNPDAIGIEVIGMYAFTHSFVPELLETLHLKAADVYRHPMVQEKMKSEAAAVGW